MKRFRELNISKINNKAAENGGKVTTCCNRKPVFYSEIFKQVFEQSSQNENEIAEDKPYAANDEDIENLQKKALVNLDIETYNML